VLIHGALWALLCAFVSKSDVLSHVTQRVVDGIRARPDAGVPVVVVFDDIPAVSSLETASIDPADWLRIPPPSRFMVYADADDMYGKCLIGVFLDSIGVAPAVISWLPVDWDSRVEMELPANALGAFFAVLDYMTDSLSLRRVDWSGAIDGYEILSLRKEFDAYR